MSSLYSILSMMVFIVLLLKYDVDFTQGVLVLIYGLLWFLSGKLEERERLDEQRR